MGIPGTPSVTVRCGACARMDRTAGSQARARNTIMPIKEGLNAIHAPQNPARDAEVESATGHGDSSCRAEGKQAFTQRRQAMQQGLKSTEKCARTAKSATLEIKTAARKRCSRWVKNSYVPQRRIRRQAGGRRGCHNVSLNLVITECTLHANAGRQTYKQVKRPERIRRWGRDRRLRENSLRALSITGEV